MNSNIRIANYYYYLLLPSYFVIGRQADCIIILILKLLIEPIKITTTYVHYSNVSIPDVYGEGVNRDLTCKNKLMRFRAPQFILEENSYYKKCSEFKTV